MVPTTFIFIGRSGCGKGTQASLLKDYLEKQNAAPVYYLQTGAAFREFIKGKTYTHFLSNEIYQAGGLQPEFLAVSIWANLLINNLKDHMHLIADGTPRHVNEAKMLGEAMVFYRRAIPFVVYMNVSRRWAKERLLGRGRFDDNEIEIEKRLNWFDGEVMPVVEFLRTSPNFRFFEINGEQTIEKVHEDIMREYHAHS